jgi:Putative Ig domain
MSVITGPSVKVLGADGLAGVRHQNVLSPSAVRFTPSTYTVTVAASALKGGTVGSAYSETIVGQGGTPPYTFSLDSGTLPAGTTLNAATGVISGTPTTAATYSFAIRATDTLGVSGALAFSIAIANAPGGSGSGSFGWVN